MLPKTLQIVGELLWCFWKGGYLTSNVMRAHAILRFSADVQLIQIMHQYWPESQDVAKDFRVGWAEVIVSHSSPSSIVSNFQTSFLSQTASSQSYFYGCIQQLAE